MYVRVVTSRQGSKTYRSAQIVESFRDPASGGKPRTRVLLHLGNVEELDGKKLDGLVDGLLRAVGRPRPEVGEIDFPFAHDFGHVWAVLGVWQQLKIGVCLQERASESRREFDLEAHIRTMVVNRLCDPRSKLGLLAWLEGVYLPGIDRTQINHDNLLRAMDFLLEQKSFVEKQVFGAVRTLFDDEFEMVFYDLTSSYFEGERSIAADDIRKYGYSRDHRSDRRQIVIGMVTTTDGIPIAHHVFPGNTLDKKTVEAVVKDLTERLGLQKVTFVGDRGLLSEGVREVIRGAGMDYLLAHALRRDADSATILKQTEGVLSRARKEGQELLMPAGMYAFRPNDHFAVSYDPEIAQTRKESRERKLGKTDAYVAETFAKLAAANAPGRRGRKLTPQGAQLRIHDYLRDHEAERYYDVHLDSCAPFGLVVEPRQEARAWEERIDGVLIVETSRSDWSAKDAIERYRSLAEIERSWRTLKSTLRLRPMFHWTEDRIRAHVFICVLALVIERVMRKRLAPIGTSVPAALDVLKRIKAGVATVQAKPVPVLTNVREEARAIYRQLALPLPRVADVVDLTKSPL